MPSGPLRRGALTAALLTLCVIATPDSPAWPPVTTDPRIRELQAALVVYFERYADAINRVQSERELQAIEASLDKHLREAVTSGDQILRRFTYYKTSAETRRRSAQALEDRIAAEKSRMQTVQIDSEVVALERVIAQTSSEIAALEGRTQRPVELETKLQAMPDTGYMNAQPREQLQAELAQARQQVPNPSEITTLRRQLQGYEAELQTKRARQPVPDAGVLRQLEGQLKAIRVDIRLDEDRARRERETFQQRRGTILALGEATAFLKDMIAGKRQMLAAPTGVAATQRTCQTNQGPFRCTGAFDATWENVCTTDIQSRDSGHATVAFSVDGWVEARMQSNTPGETPRTLVGKINSAGQVTGDRSSSDDAEQWQGAFSLVTLAQASGMKPVGGGTYAYSLKNDSGGYLLRCTGTLKLL